MHTEAASTVFDTHPYYMKHLQGESVVHGLSSFIYLLVISQADWMEDLIKQVQYG